MKTKQWQRRLISLLLLIAAPIFVLYLLQHFVAHRDDRFIPDYPRVTLSEQSDPETVFLQTGLGPAVAAQLLEQGNLQTVLDMQDAFFTPTEGVCTPLLGWFTREDRLPQPGPPLIDLQPGDILISLSTHTVGWRHGHAGLVMDDGTVLESAVLGADSVLANAERWRTYSNYAVLRPKQVSPEVQQAVAQFGRKTLLGMPYRLTCGLIGAKAPDPDTPGFGLHCSYLVWYAWNRFGYDLDSDGGRLVTASDLLFSERLEVVQVYGMDPRLFLTS